MPPLSILLWLPAACGLLGALVSLLLRSGGDGGASGADPASEAELGTGEGEHLRFSVPGVIALIGTLGVLGLAIGYIADYSPSHHGLAHVTDVVWISELGIHYKLGIDGLNVFMLGLTTLLFAVAVLAANLRRWERPRLFYFNFMLAES
ncbi:MAG TPA: hypothetical protein VGI52_02815, partial [Solirubrobacteraceae bacterium]